jgi:hypothetical protein
VCRGVVKIVPGWEGRIGKDGYDGMGFRIAKPGVFSNVIFFGFWREEFGRGVYILTLLTMWLVDTILRE